MIQIYVDGPFLRLIESTVRLTPEISELHPEAALVPLDPCARGIAANRVLCRLASLHNRRGLAWNDAATATTVAVSGGTGLVDNLGRQFGSKQDSICLFVRLVT